MSEPTLASLAAEVTALRTRVKLLEDLEAIRQLKARYFRLVDEKDWDGWRELFTDDAYFEFRDGTSVIGGAAFTEAVHGMLDGPMGTAVSVHSGHMPEITLVGPDHAHGTWAVADYIEWPTEPDSSEREGRRGYGHHHEVYRNVDGRWKIAEWRLSYLRSDPLSSKVSSTPDTASDAAGLNDEHPDVT